MSKTQFVENLRSVAEILGPLAGKNPDPYALAWWSTLLATASLIEAQDCAVTAAQQTYLRGQLFGGMGSLNDLSFADGGLNENLDKARSDLFASFQRL